MDQSRGQTKIVLQSNEIDFSNIYHSKTNEKVKKMAASQYNLG